MRRRPQPSPGAAVAEPPSATPRLFSLRRAGAERSGAGAARLRGTRPCAAGNVSRIGSGGGAAPPGPARPGPRVLRRRPRAPSPGVSSRSHSLFGTGCAGLSLRLRRARLPASGAMLAARRSPPPPAGGGPPPPAPGLPPGAGRLRGGRRVQPPQPGRAAGRWSSGPGRSSPPPRRRAVPATQVRRRFLSHGAAASPPLAAPRAGPRAAAAAAGREASGSGRGPRPALPLMHCERRRAPAPAA